MKINLQDMFEEFAEARRNGFLIVKDVKESGNNIVGTFCTYTPKELIYAAGAYPVSLCSISESTIPEAEKHLPKNLCPLIKSSYGHALKESCPYMYFSDFIVGETTCDGKKKMYELLGEIKDTYIMQLPQDQDNKYGKLMWEEEMYRFKNKLEEKFNVVITDDNVRDAIVFCNEERKVLKEFYSLGKLVPPPISGYDMNTILNGVIYTFDKKIQNEKLRIITEQLREAHRNGESKIPVTAPRILITGCPMGGVADKVIKQLENVGAVVVTYENCGGAKNLARLVDEKESPMKALADKYLSIPCSVMSPNKGRESLLKELIEDYHVDGVIEIVLQACHTYAVETRSIGEIMKSLSTPFISLETDYSTTDTGQLRTRLEAFVEML